MNIFKKFYFRTYQTVFKMALPFLPYREPEILKSNDDVAIVLKDTKISNVLLVTDKGIRNLGQYMKMWYQTPHHKMLMRR